MIIRYWDLFKTKLNKVNISLFNNLRNLYILLIIN
jgi:hypothetical protein